MPPDASVGHKRGINGQAARSVNRDHDKRHGSAYDGPVTVSLFSTSHAMPSFRFGRIHADGSPAGTAYGYRLLGFVEYRETTSGSEGLDVGDTIVKRHLFEDDFPGYQWSPVALARHPARRLNVPANYTATTTFSHPTLGPLLQLEVQFTEDQRPGPNGRCLGPDRFEHSIRLLNPFSPTDDDVKLALIGVVDHASGVERAHADVSPLSAVRILGGAGADDASVGFFAWDRQALCDGKAFDLHAQAWGPTPPVALKLRPNPFTEVEEAHVFFSWSLLAPGKCREFFWDPANGIAAPETRGVDDGTSGPVYDPITGVLQSTPLYATCKDSARWDTNTYALRCGAACALASLNNANGFVAVTGRLARGQGYHFKEKEQQGYYSSKYNFGNGVGKPPSVEKGHKGKEGGKERDADPTEKDGSDFVGPVTVSFFTTAGGVPNFRFARLHAGNGNGAGTAYGYRLLGFVEYRDAVGSQAGFDAGDNIVHRHLFGSSDFDGFAWTSLNVTRFPDNDYNVAGDYTVTTTLSHPSLGAVMALTVQFSEQLRTGFNGRCLGPERFEHSIRLLRPFSNGISDDVRLAVIGVVDHSSRVANYSPMLSYLTAIQIFGDAGADDYSVAFFAWDRQAVCDGTAMDFVARSWGVVSPLGSAVGENPYTDTAEDHNFFSWSLLSGQRCSSLDWDPANGIAQPITRDTETTSDASDDHPPAVKGATMMGVIVGTVMGLAALIGLVVAVVVRTRHKRRRRREQEEAAAQAERRVGRDHDGGTPMSGASSRRASTSNAV